MSKTQGFRCAGPAAAGGWPGPRGYQRPHHRWDLGDDCPLS